jgi:predicted metal-binding membrane protein
MRLSVAAGLSRDRGIVLAALAAITLLAWIYLFGLTASMSDMAGTVAMGDMPGMPTPSLGRQFALAATMWAVMMAGMMLPSAAPMVLMFTSVQRRQGMRPVPMTGLFLAGYLLLWGGFAIAAAGLQIGLERAALLSPTLALLNARVTASSFVLAGLYEFSPLKHRCLQQCRGPLAFIIGHWRPGLAGAFRMGATHGALCLGCCWVLMLLLFAAGVMNLLWVAALSALVLGQKVLPGGRWTWSLTGTAMLAFGVVLLLR